METATATEPSEARVAPLLETGSQQAQPARPAAVQSDSATEAKRAKWRAKYHAKKARKNSLPGKLTLDALPPSTGLADPVPQAAPAPAVVPWDSNLLKPLFDELIPIAEREHISKLTKRAEKISADLAHVVKTDAAWSPTAKTSLLVNGPIVTAKYLNMMGIPADAAPEVFLGLGLAAIWNGHRILSNKLDEMAAKLAPQPAEVKAAQEATPENVSKFPKVTAL